jgi:thioredoxin reductase
MKTKVTLSHQVAIIGAGPYGLATAAHSARSRFRDLVFGEPMEFWESQMPEGMPLCSSWDLTLNNY